MSKKQKRKVSQGARQPTTVVAPQTTTVPTPKETSRPTYNPPARTTRPSRGGSSASGAGSRRFMPAPEFKPDYTYVKKDLKRIGIIAGSFFGILIVLSFFLK